jgi:uncharacterized protein (DUF2062 family)
VRGWNRHVIKRARALWQRAKEERASPRQVGVSVGVGVLACFAPIPWTHVPLALLFSSVLRVNRVWAVVGSQIPSLFGLLRPLIMFAEIEVAHRLRTGEWLELDIGHAMAQAPRLMLDLFVGAGLLGAGAGLAAGLSAYAYGRRVMQRRRDALPPRTSGSPPSAPPARTS